jgi:hypothetical protein
MNRKIPINRKRFPGLLVVTFLLFLGFGHAAFFPEKYLAGKNAITRRSLKRTIKRWGSPILISEKSVDYNLNELKETISTLLHDYKEGITAGA